MVETPVFPFSPRLRVTADARGGSMMVSAVDADGAIVMTSRPVVENVTDALVEWNSDGASIAEVAGRPLTLRFEFNNAAL